MPIKINQKKHFIISQAHLKKEKFCIKIYIGRYNISIKNIFQVLFSKHGI